MDINELLSLKKDDMLLYKGEWRLLDGQPCPADRDPVLVEKLGLDTLEGYYQVMFRDIHDDTLGVLLPRDIVESW